MNRVDPRKLDADLLALLQTGHLAPDERLPVVVTAVTGRLGEVREVVEERGTVRHLLEPLDAVSAWLSLSDVTELSAFDSIRALELAQAMQLAT